MSKRDKDANKILGMVVEALEDDSVLEVIDEVGNEYRPDCRNLRPNINKLMKSRYVQGVLKTLVTRMVDAMTFANGNEDEGES